MHVLTDEEMLRYKHPSLWKSIHSDTLPEGGKEFEQVAEKYPKK